MRSFGRCSSLFVLIALLMWLGGCRGLTGASLDPETARQLQGKVNHIIFMVQENRSFDHYLGQLGQYREANGYGKASDIDGMPATASNPNLDGTADLKTFHLKTTCVEEVSGSWLESHADVNLQNPGSSKFLMDGFVAEAAKYARANDEYDVDGLRVIGYYDETDIPFYYFMAANFATSDRFFSPLMSESIPNRMYLIAGTSGGHAHPPDASAGQCCDNLPTIFHRLSDAGISWKIYYSDTDQNGKPVTDINNYWPKFAAAHTNNIVPISQYFVDLGNQTLPAVSFIQAGLASGRDEHPGGQQVPQEGGNDIQKGALYVAQIIAQLMESAMWKDSVFILSFDEGGSFYDHVPPSATVKPDDLDPTDLQPTDAVIKPPATFNHTGFRIPLIVISPFSKKNYVSHTPMDSTAILTLIEERFGLDPLTKRDESEPTMTEFLNFDNPPWMSPPMPPEQPVDGRCDPKNLPSAASLTTK